MLSDGCGDIDILVHDVTLVELVTEALIAADAESVALALAVVVVDDTSEGDAVTKIEKETTADDDTLADADVLDVVLMELVIEALSAAVAESDAQAIAEEVVVGVS